jgi:hypothetical protein
MPTRSQAFLDGSGRDPVTLGSMTVGRGIFQPGSRWSAHARPLAGHGSERHVGFIVSGRMIIIGADGGQVEVGPGDASDAQPGHDAWVLGEKRPSSVEVHRWTQRVGVQCA